MTIDIEAIRVIDEGIRTLSNEGARREPPLSSADIDALEQRIGGPIAKDELRLLSGAALGGLGKVGGWFGGKLFKVVPNKTPGRETIAWLRTKVFRVESHPTSSKLPSWLKVPHAHLDFLGKPYSKWHIPFPDPPVIAGAAIGASADMNDCECDGR